MASLRHWFRAGSFDQGTIFFTVEYAACPNRALAQHATLRPRAPQIVAGNAGSISKQLFKASLSLGSRARCACACFLCRCRTLRLQHFLACSTGATCFSALRATAHTLRKWESTLK